MHLRQLFGDETFFAALKRSSAGRYQATAFAISAGFKPVAKMRRNGSGDIGSRDNTMATPRLVR
jgi:hypothetical protein